MGAQLQSVRCTTAPQIFWKILENIFPYDFWLRTKFFAPSRFWTTLRTLTFAVSAIWAKISQLSISLSSNYVIKNCCKRRVFTGVSMSRPVARLFGGGFECPFPSPSLPPFPSPLPSPPLPPLSLPSSPSLPFPLLP